MGLKISIDDQSVQVVKKRLIRQADLLRAKRPANLKAAVVMRQWIVRNFDAEGGLHRNAMRKWPRLEPIGIALRKMRHPSATITAASAKPLQDTGRLKNHWDLRADDHGAEVQSRANYSRVHEEGGMSVIGFGKLKGKSIRVHQRKILPVPEQAMGIVLPVYRSFVGKVIS